MARTTRYSVSFDEDANVQDVVPQANTQFDAGDYTASLQTLAQLRAPVDAFFDSVMVNADDPALRANRLGLLASLHAAMNRVADLSRLDKWDRPRLRTEVEELARRRAVVTQEVNLAFPLRALEVVLLGRLPHLTGAEGPADQRLALRALRKGGREGSAAEALGAQSSPDAAPARRRSTASRIWRSSRRCSSTGFVT